MFLSLIVHPIPFAHMTQNLCKRFPLLAFNLEVKTIGGKLLLLKKHVHCFFLDIAIPTGHELLNYALLLSVGQSIGLIFLYLLSSYFDTFCVVISRCWLFVIQGLITKHLAFETRFNCPFCFLDIEHTGQIPRVNTVNTVNTNHAESHG